MENTIKPYEISLWEDVYDEQRKIYTEKKILIIGSSSMKTSNRAFSPILRQNLNGETTLEFSLLYKVYNEFTHIKTINPFMPFLVNERKVKLKYGDEWFDFILKEKQESSENTFTYSCSDTNILELSKQGYNVTFSSELNNNQGTAIELGTIALENSNWSIDEEKSDILRSYTDEPVYKGELNQDITVYNMEKPYEDAITLKEGERVYLFYSQIFEQKTTDLQLVKADEKFVYDDNGVAKGTNYRYTGKVTYDSNKVPNIIKKGDAYEKTKDTVIYTNKDYYVLEGGVYKKVDSPQLIELPNYYEKYYSSAIFTDYQVKRLVRKPSVTYDKTTGKMVDIYTAPGARGPIDIYHYTDTLYSTPDILVDYMANGNNFDLSVEGSTNGWMICSEDSVNNSIVVDTYPTLEMITNSPGYLVDVRNYLIMTLDSGAYVYNSGIQGNRYLIKEFVQGEKYSFKIRVGQLSEGELVGLTEAPKFKMVIASYTYGENGRPIMGNVLFDFVPTTIDGLDSPRIENIEVSNGVFGENKTQYVVDGVVQAPNPMYYYREGDGALHKWNPNEKKYEVKTTKDLNFYRYDAICKRSIGDLMTSTEEIGIFIQNTADSRLTYYIESIQLFKHIIIDGKTAMIGDVPSAVNINKDYFYLAPEKDAKKSSVKFYSSKANIASSLGIDESLIKLKFDENCQMVSMIEVDNSNYFDILQQICEKFECWLKFEIEREENGAPKIDLESGKPIKKIAFKKYIGKDNYAGFKYGINLVKIDRTVSSEEIVTKLIVPESENQYADGGSVTIQKAPSNISGSSYILNFNYFVKQGLLDSGLNDLVDFYNQMKERNTSLIEKRAEKSKIDLAIVKLESQRNVFSELLKNAQSTKDEAIVDFKRVANTDYDTYIRDNNPLDKNKNSVLDLVTQIKVCDHYISTYKSSTQKLYEALETQRRKSEGYPERVLEIIEVNGKYVWSLDDYFEGLVFTLSREENGEKTAEEVFETNFYTKSGSTSWAPTQITFNHVPDGYKERKESIAITLPFSITIEPEKEDEGLKAQIEKEEKEKDKIEREFLNKFGPFIQEGTWNSNEYIDSELYYLDAVKAAYNSGKPQVEYSIDVIEISGLEDYEGYEFKIGDKTYIEDTEFFGYIQVNGIPTPVKEEVVVSEIIHHLDSPEEDSISVKNYKTEFEDLFQRLAATTQSIQYKEGSYARAASAIDVSGIINPEVLLNTFGAVGNQVWDLTTNGIIKITGDGIITTDLHDANNKIKVGAGIIYTTTDGGQTWVEAFTPTGMKTSFLKAGVINTDKVFIMNDNKPAFRWDKVGLNAFSYDSKEEKYKYNTFVRFDQYGIYGVKMPEWEDKRDPEVPESDYEYFVPDSIADVEDKAIFGLTWNGFFLKSLYEDGYVSISNTDDIEVKRKDVNGNYQTIIKIGAFRNSTNPYLVEKYGIRISDYNGTPVFETGDDGRVYIKDQLQVGRNEWNHSAIIIDGANSLIKSSNYSDGGGLGWLINQEGDAFFNNITARGAIRTAVFEYSEIQAVGGIFLFRPSAVIKSAKIVPKTPTEEYGDIIITLDKQYLFDVGDWCKIGNYLGEGQSADASLDPSDILENNGLTHVYRVTHATGNTIRLDEGQRLIEEGIAEVDSEGFIPSLAGAALINMGNEAQTNNYGIGINSSDNTVNLPRRSISLFETRIHRDSEVKVSYDFSNVLGTLPYISDLKVDSDIYNKYMKETQGIFTNNMYIGDRNQYIAFYTDDAGLAHLKINASELIFGHDPVTQEEISWSQLINQLQENTIISSLGYQITSKDDYGYIYPRAFKNGVELDPLPFNVVDNHGEALPERPKEGDYFLILDRENKTAICKQFTNGKWVDVIWECEYEWEFLIGPNGVKPSIDSNSAKNKFVYVDYDVIQDGFTAKVAITNYIGEYFLEYNNKYFRVQYENNPEEVRYILTRDKRVVPNKTYYRYNSITQKYEAVVEPKQEEIGTYYEIDERFFLVKKPDLLKTYESITIQNGLSQRYFWFNTSDRRTGDGYNIVSSGAYVLDTPAEEFKREHKGHYVLVRSKGVDTDTNYGIIIGKDLIKYMILNDLGLTFYNSEGAKAMELTQEQLAFYDKNEKLRMNLDSESLDFYDKNEILRMNLNSESLNLYDKNEILRMELDSESLSFYDKNETIKMKLDTDKLKFYGSNVVKPDALLDSNGLVLEKGGIIVGTPGIDNSVYISSENYGSKISIGGENTNWHAIIGSKFGVLSDGTLYADNAEIKGAIDATSFIARYNDIKRAEVNNTGLIVYDTDGTTSLASFGRNAIIGKTSSGHIRISTSGMYLMNEKNKLADFDSDGIYLYYDDDDNRVKATITEYGLYLYNNVDYNAENYYKACIDSYGATFFDDSGMSKVALNVSNGNISLKQNNVDVGYIGFSKDDFDNNLYGLSLHLKRSTSTAKPGWVGITAINSAGKNIYKFIYLQDNASISNYTPDALNAGCDLDMNNWSIKDIGELYGGRYFPGSQTSKYIGYSANGAILINSPLLVNTESYLDSHALVVNGAIAFLTNNVFGQTRISTDYYNGSYNMYYSANNGYHAFYANSLGVFYVSSDSLTCNVPLKIHSDFGIVTNEITSSSGIYFNANDAKNEQTLVWTTNGNLRYDGTVAQGNIGTSGDRWTTVYLKNNPNVSSDRKLKDNINTIDFAEALIMSLEPVTFMWKDGDHRRKHMGFIAQDTASICNKIGENLALVSASYKKTSNDKEDDYVPDYFGEEVDDKLLNWGMSKEELIAPIVQVIQKQQQQLKHQQQLIDNLQQQVKKLQEDF